MINYKPHKKLYYTSGLISLLLLPILCVLYVQKTKVFERLYAIELNAWTPKQAKIWRKYGYDYNIRPNRNFINIYLTGNEKEDKIKLDFVQLQLRDLVKSKDTISGVHIILGNNSKYWTLIEIINISMKEKARRFTYVGNDFWFFNYFPKPVKKKEDFRHFCGTKYVDYIIDLEDKEEQNQILQRLKETPQRLIIFYILLSILFLFMCGIEIKRIFYARDV